MNTILSLLQELLASPGDVVMAWVQYIPMLASAVATGYGAVQQGKKNDEMRRKRAGWQSENKAMFDSEYLSDYTQRADAQNIIRQMRDQFDRESKRDRNTSVITGGTAEADAARKEGRNRAMSNLMGNLGAMGQRHKDRAKDRYLHRKNQLDMMEYGDLAQQAESAGNLFYNGLGSLAGTDWSGMFSGDKKPFWKTLSPSVGAPIKASDTTKMTIGTPKSRDLGGIIPKYK
ncbi:MAG: hypothetical protein WC914_00110 [Proteiniphilum sp.]